MCTFISHVSQSVKVTFIRSKELTSDSTLSTPILRVDVTWTITEILKCLALFQ